MGDTITTDEATVAEAIATGVMPPGAQTIIDNITAVSSPPAPPTEEERKSLFFRLLYKVGRAVAMGGRAVKRSWNYVVDHSDSILAFTVSLGIGAAVGFGLTVVYLWLMTISPLLAYAFLAAIIAQASVTLVAFTAKVFVERRQRLTSTEVAVL